MRDKSELGSLFNLNTVLAKVSRAKKRAFDIAVGQAKKHVYGSAEDAVVSQVLRKASYASTFSMCTAQLKTP